MESDPPSTVRTFFVDSVSWGAVLAGVVVALVTQLVLSLFGIAVGAGTLGQDAGDASARALSTGAAIWWIVSAVLSTALGAYVAARLAGKPSASTGMWHGLTTWAVTTLVTFWLVTSAVGGVVGGALRMVTDATGGAVSGVATQAGDAALDPEAEGTADGGRAAVMAALRAAVASGDPAQVAEARDEAARAIARNRGMPIEQARAQVARAERRYRDQAGQAGQQASAVAEDAARAVSRGALWSAIALVLGAIASALAGRAGTVDPGRQLLARRLETHPA